MMEYALLTLAVLNGIATSIVWATGDYEGSQKRAQTVLVWLLPLFGAVVVLAVRWSNRSPPVGHDQVASLYESSVDVSAEGVPDSAHHGDVD